MTLSIRRWTRDDLPTVQPCCSKRGWMLTVLHPREDLVGYLHTQYSPAKLEALFADPDVTGLVAELDDAVSRVRQLYHARAEQRFYVHQLYILPSETGLGLGHRLMACG